MNEVELSTKDLAEIFGVSDRTVRDLAERGVIQKIGRGRYELLASTTAYLRHLREVAAARGGEAQILDLNQERARLAREQADGQELKNKQLRVELVPVADVEREWSDILRGIRTSILAVTSRVRQAAGLTAPQVVELDAELRRTLTDLGNDKDDPAQRSEGVGTAAKAGALDMD